MKCNIWKDCPKVPITELLSFIVDNRGKTVPTASSGHKLIATNCVTNHSLFPSYEKIRYLSEETYQTWFRAHPRPGDILFVNKGTPGRVCMVPDPVDFCIAQDMIALRTDNNKIYNKYLFAVLRSREIQEQIYNTSVGDVIPHFKKQFLQELLIPVPDRKLQELIGDLYYVLSYKEEYNKKINDNLERQAQAIYKSWFVDFEPFNYRQPNNWKQGIVEDLASEIICGKTPATKKKEYYGHDMPFITIPDMHDVVYALNTERSLSFLGIKSQEKKTLPANSVAVSCIGTAGLVSLIPVPSQTNQQINSIIPRKGVSHFYIYLLMQTMAETIKKFGQGGSTIENLNKTRFGKMEVLVPSDDVMESFGDTVEPLFEKILNNQKESQRLEKIRDMILPKMMSGEIDFCAIAN